MKIWIIGFYMFKENGICRVGYESLFIYNGKFL